MPKDSRSKKVRRGGARSPDKKLSLVGLLSDSYSQLNAAIVSLNDAIGTYNNENDDVTNKKTIIDILQTLLAVLNLLDENMKPVAEKAPAEGATGAAEGAKPPEAAKAEETTPQPPGTGTGGGSRKKKHSKTVKRGGGDLDMSKLYNVSGLIVDTKDPVGVAGKIGQDSTPMPFSANGQGIRYTGGISQEFMNELNPSQGVAGGAKKKTKGKK